MGARWFCLSCIRLACSAGVLWAAEAACLCSYCCNRPLCYDGGRQGRVKIVTLRVGARAKEGRIGGVGGWGEKKICPI